MCLLILLWCGCCLAHLLIVLVLCQVKTPVAAASIQEANFTGLCNALKEQQQQVRTTERPFELTVMQVAVGSFGCCRKQCQDMLHVLVFHTAAQHDPSPSTG